MSEENTSVSNEVATPSGNGMDFIDSGMNEVAEALATADTKEESSSELAPTEADSAEGGESSTAAATSPEDSVEGGADTSTEVTTTAAPAIEDKAPITWKPEVAAKWAELPPEVKAEVQRREADIFRGIEGYKGRAEVGDKFTQVFAPYKEVMEKYNVDPIVTTANLMAIHERLSFGSQEERENIISRVAKDYGVDLAKLAEKQTYVDPEVQKIIDENYRLKQEQLGQQRQQSTQRESQFMQQVTEFAADPKNIYFNEVADDIAKLINGGVETDLQKAYEKAVRLNPTTWAKEEARIRTESAQAAAAEALEKKKKLETATSANVQTSESSSNTATGSVTMDDTMAQTLANIKKREKT